MSDFDEWFKSLNEGGRTTYFLGQEGKISKEAWDFQQAKIDCMQVRLDGANERAMSLLNHKNVMVDKMQAEIDEFKKLRSLDEMAINQLAQANQVWQIKCDELQARVDATLEKCYIGIRKQGGDHYLELVEDILKGNKDEN